MTNKYIYLNNNATTPLDPRVLEAMMPYMTDLYGNASSSHLMGKRIKQAVDKAREQVGELINANPENIIFTSGATEAINMAIRGVIAQCGIDNPHIITISTEHPAVLDTCQYLESRGVEVTYLPVDDDGLINLSLNTLEASYQDNTVLVCAMGINNETGVLQPFGRMASSAHERGVLLMCDATQFIGRYEMDVIEKEVDILAMSAHKFYGPKGVGALYIRPGLNISPLLFGGGHQNGLRSGTLNTAGIVGMGKAASLVQESLHEEIHRLFGLRKKLEDALLKIDGTKQNGHDGFRACNVTNITFQGVDSDALILNLKNICVSNGSACHSFTMEPSHVLLAMGLTNEEANSSIRFSLGRFNTEEEIDYTIEQVSAAVERLRAIA